MITLRTRPALTVQLALALALAGLLIGGCKKKPADDGKKDKPAATQKTDVKAKAGAADEKKPKKAMEASRGLSKPAMRPVAGMTATPPTTPPARPTARPAGKVAPQLLLGVNIAKLRKTFIWKTVMAMDAAKKILADETYTKIKKALGTDPLKIIDSASLVIAGQSLASIKNADHLAILVTGRFDAAQILRKLLTVPMKPGKPKPKLTKLNGKDALVGTNAKKSGEFAIIAVSKNSLAISSISMAKAVTDGDLAAGDVVIKGQLKHVNAKALLYGVFGAVKLPSGQQAIPALAALSKIAGGSFHIDVDKGKWSAGNRLDLGTPQAAKALIQFVTMMKMAFGKAGSRPGGPPPAVMSILKKIQIKANGQVVNATLGLSEAEVKGLFGMLLKKM